MAGEADRSWMNELLVGYAPVSTEQQDLSPPRRNGLRALGVGASRRLFELRLCGLRLYEEHERLG